MPSNQRSFSTKSTSGGPIRHCHLKTVEGAVGQEFTPFFFLEAKIDLADVRSGLRESLSVSKALEIVRFDGDMLWTEDMVRTVDPALIESGLPASAAMKPFPSHVDDAHLRWVEGQFLSYLLRHFQVCILHNPLLHVYSLPGESMEDFTARCLEMLAQPFRVDLDGIREVCDRRLERVKVKYLRTEATGGFTEARVSSEARNRIHEMAERIEELFVRAELTAEPSAGDPMFPEAPDGTLRERLASIETEARQAIRRLAIEYAERAGNVDAHVVRPSLKDIQLGGVSILWMPSRVAT